MKRDWNFIRELLLAIEEDKDLRVYTPDEPKQETQSREEYERQLEEYVANESKFFGHLELLIKNGFIEGVIVSRGMDNHWSWALSSPRLTMAGHDLLDTMRSSTIWESIKSTAKIKGIELTFDSIKYLGSFLLSKLVGA